MRFKFVSKNLSFLIFVFVCSCMLKHLWGFSLLTRIHLFNIYCCVQLSVKTLLGLRLRQEAIVSVPFIVLLYIKSTARFQFIDKNLSF